ncbi:phosphonoacetate hydrolase [Rhizobium sp.]
MPQRNASTEAATRETAVNGRTYRWPDRTTVVICFDGCDPEYIETASKAGVIPTLDAIRRDGFESVALAAMPTFTNPNNVSIVCGAPPAVHGVSGNYYIDRKTGQEVMMVDAKPMQAETILAALSKLGASVIAVTAKDKLRKALAHNMTGIAFSAEKAAESTMEENGIANVTDLVGRQQPDQYSADLSLFVLDAGIALIGERKPDLVYLSLSDYVQHAHAPSEAPALNFMGEVDQRVKKLLDLGAVVAIVADHGMNDMSSTAGDANVLYVGDILDAEYGEGAAKVICPITDPFVRHHGALGGFVRVHLKTSENSPDKVASFLKSLPGIEEALTREEVCARFSLPSDKEGDVAVIAAKGVALGARKVDHDLSALAGARLRSHGGLFEQRVPFIVSEKITAEFLDTKQGTDLRNFDVFDFALNGVVS